MSTIKTESLVKNTLNGEFGVRLKTERKRLGFKNQGDLSELLGIQQGRQSDYERGKYLPNADYLIRLHEKGFDVLWILTCMHGQLDDDTEQHLLAQLHQASGERRAAAIAAALAVLDSKPAADKSESIPRQVFSGNVGNVIDRNEGAITQTFGKK